MTDPAHTSRVQVVLDEIAHLDDEEINAIERQLRQWRLAAAEREGTVQHESGGSRATVEVPPFPFDDPR